MSCRESLDHITFGLILMLEEKADISDVRLVECEPAKLGLIESWEECNMCKLPDDLKQFYLMMNGLLIQWSVRFDDTIQQLGNLEINPIESLTQLSEEGSALSSDDITLQDFDTDEDVFDTEGHRKPHFNETNFVLSSDDTYGKVCLIYKEKLSEVWFLDRALEWYFLSSSYRTYFRMLVVHFGIPGWQYLFTDVGLSPQTEQWFNLYLPHLVSTTKSNTESNTKSISITATQEKEVEFNKVDFNILFKSKSSNERKTEQTRKPKNSLKKKVRGSARSSLRNTMK